MSNLKIAIIGLGYVGLDLAIQLAHHYSLIGYDVPQRIEELQQAYDRNHQFFQTELTLKNLQFSSDIKDFRSACVFIVCVPTPVLYYKIPDLELLKTATTTIAEILKPGDTVIYESSVYPGTTNTICLPILEQHSKLMANQEFFIGYSPERINPGDKEHTLKTVTKLISANHPNTLELMQQIYGSICKKLHKCSSIEIAEASKLLENIQRDVNIALMNEFTQVMHGLKLNTQEIIEAAATKYNFARYQPGLVGGHCISIDPEYLVFLAHQHQLDTPLISMARQVNNSVTQFIRAELLRLLLIKSDHPPPYRIGIFGVTYKPNVPDTRNSLVFKFIKECRSYPLEFQLHDPFYEGQTLNTQCPIRIQSLSELSQLDVGIIFVGHDAYQELGLEFFIQKSPIIMDAANLFYTALKSKHLDYWHL